MRLLVLVSVLAVQASVRASEDYPKIVQWERTESETFVSKPNVLDGVDYFTATIVPPNPTKKETHAYTNRENGNEARDCYDDDSNVQPRLAVMRPDLPGSFVCGTKTLYVIPVIRVQLHRFFNVSLDFLKVRGTSENVKMTRSNNLPLGLAFSVEPSGIVFVSGMIRAGIGTLVPRLTFRSRGGDSLYRIKIILHIEDSEPRENRTLVEIGMVPNRIDSGASDIQQQIKAVKCAASALSLNPWDLHGVNPEQEFASTLKLRAYFEFSENSCTSDPRKSIRCDDFSITGIVSDQPRCALDATNENLDRKPQIMETTEKSESEENLIGDVSDVRIEHNQIVTGAPTSTTTRSPSSTTTTTGQMTASFPSSVPPKLDVDVSREPKSVDSEPDSEVRSASISPTLLQKNEVSNQIQDDAKLRTAMYGILGLATIVITIAFLFFFSRLELCKKKAGYDPVFMARMSDDNGKFA